MVDNFRVPEKVVEVELPRLNIQIAQEWSTPNHQKLTEVKDDNDEGKVHFLKKGLRKTNRPLNLHEIHLIKLRVH